MNANGKVWVQAAVIVGVALLLSIVMAASGSKALENLATLPGMGGLFGALFIVARDKLAHERSIFLQEASHRFSIGATSHMASVAFDKHVEFCEEYYKAMLEIIGLLFGKGPTREALMYSAKLAEIRSRWTLWLDPLVEADLAKFEHAIRKMGAEGMVLDSLPVGESRSAAVERMYLLFAEVTGIDWEKGEKRDLSADVLHKLREILEIRGLTTLRTDLVKRALGGVE